MDSRSNLGADQTQDREVSPSALVDPVVREMLYLIKFDNLKGFLRYGLTKHEILNLRLGSALNLLQAICFYNAEHMLIWLADLFDSSNCSGSSSKKNQKESDASAQSFNSVNEDLEDESESDEFNQ